MALAEAQGADALCPRCGAQVTEDLRVASDARVLTPGLLIRQFRCWNGHSHTDNPYRDRRRPIFRVVCDICQESFLTCYEQTRRHAACHNEHERRRKRQAALALRLSPERLCNALR
jgi:hypothetical protein